MHSSAAKTKILNEKDASADYDEEMAERKNAKQTIFCLALIMGVGRQAYGWYQVC